MEEKTTASRPVEPIKVAVVASGDAVKLPNGIIAETNGPHEPNIVVTVVQPLLAIGIRFVNVFLVQFVGLLVAGMTPAGGKLLYTGDFAHLLLVCASLALPGAGLGFFKDLVTIFSGLEKRWPLASGAV